MKSQKNFLRTENYRKISNLDRSQTFLTLRGQIPGTNMKNVDGELEIKRKKSGKSQVIRYLKFSRYPDLNEFNFLQMS